LFVAQVGNQANDGMEKLLAKFGDVKYEGKLSQKQQESCAFPKIFHGLLF